MPVQIDVLLTMKDREGHEIVVRKSEANLPVFVEVEDIQGRRALVSKEELEKMVSSSNVNVVCDNPKCRPALIQWNQEKAGEDENHFPDAAYKMIRVIDFLGAEYVYCSKKCEAEAIPDRPEPKSPREQAKVVDISTYKKPVQKMDEEKA